MRPPVILHLLAVVVGSILVGGNAHAGWLTISNQTATPLVVQEVGEGPSAAADGRTIRLLPGEVYREFRSSAGSRPVVVRTFGRSPNAVADGRLTWGRSDRAFELRSDRAGVTFDARAEPDSASGSATTLATLSLP